MSHHKVNRVLLDFAVPNSQKEQAVGDIREMFNKEAIPIMTEVFDAVPETLYIDKLEIDLGHISPDEFAQRFQEILLVELRRNSLNPGQSPASSAAPSLLPDEKQILYFLQKGYWPWNVQTRSEDEINSLLHSFFSNSQQTVALLKNILHEDVYVAERLATLLTTDGVLLHTFLKALQRYHPVLESLLLTLPANIEKRIAVARDFYLLFFKALLRHEPLTSAPATKQFLLDLIFTRQVVTLVGADIVAQLEESLREVTDIEPLSDFFAKIDRVEKATRAGKSKKKTADSTPNLETETNQYAEASIAQPVQISEAAEDERMIINNAGLVLFHAYLPYVFRGLGWVGADNNFADAAVNQKAILFLSYILTGKSRHAEHLLILNKIMCGWPVHLPIDIPGRFSKKEKEAAIDIVDSLKEHWSILKGTSNEGLVESFVARNGIIRQQSGGFLLQVERKTIDVLIDSFPFSIGTIKLPWNDYVIHTEW